VNDAIVVRVPASSANLGAGFDVLGLALALYFDIGVGAPPDGARSIDRHHPAATAYATAAGGVQPSPELWVRSSIPMGRGLGFSGAARVGGAALAAVAASDDPASTLEAQAAAVLDVAVGLERHGDNAAASMTGGIVAWVDGTVIPLRVGPKLAAAAVVAWVPTTTTTSTDRSRSGLADDVARTDVVHNLGRVAQFVAAVEHDDPALLAGATDDRLHQASRLDAVPDSSMALAAGVDAGAWCGWLSGSGPTVAFLADVDVADDVAGALPGSGHVKRLRIATRGAHVLEC
jgi:homoserine kinase